MRCSNKLNKIYYNGFFVVILGELMINDMLIMWVACENVAQIYDNLFAHIL